MTLSSNQFAQSVIQGQLDLRFSAQTVSGQVDTTSAGGLIAGQSVKMVDNLGGIPKFVECAANTDDVFGFINYDFKSPTHAVGDKIEVACMRGNAQYMTASAAIARNAKVAVVITGSKVVTATGAMTVVGRAYDKAVNSGDLIRVVLDLPGSTAEDVTTQAADVAAITTADATDLPTSEALAIQLKVTVNAILVSLKNAGIMA